MTGKDLIIYILQNSLEDEPIALKEGFLNLMTVNEAAVKFDVGAATVKTWFKLGMLDGITVGETIYILPALMIHVP